MCLAHADYYFTKQGDTLELILKNILQRSLSTQDLTDQIKILKQNNPHINNWKQISPGQSLNLDGLKLKEVTVLDVEDQPEYYQSSSLWNISFIAAISSISFVDQLDALEVQAETASMSNWGINVEYAANKSEKALSYNLGRFQHRFNYFEDTQYYGYMQKKNVLTNTAINFGLEYRQFNFNSLRSDLFTTNKQNKFVNLLIGSDFHYYLFDEITFFRFNLIYLINSTGSEVEADSAFGLKISNQFTYKMIGIEPYLDYLYISRPNVSKFFIFGTKISLNINVL
jgi:hypothetical protein